MSYTYAIQVQTGKEIFAKQLLEDYLKRESNPGIEKIFAFETFTQIFGGKDTAPKEYKSKVPGYIFVTIEEKHHDLSLGMKSACYYLIKNIPFVCRILNQFITPDEWNRFFESVDTEPNIQITSKESRPIFVSIRAALKKLQTQKTEQAQRFRNMLQKVTSKTRGNNILYLIPFSLFQLTRDQIDNGQLEVKTLTDTAFIVPKILNIINSLV